MTQPTTVNTGGNLLGNLKVTSQQIRAAVGDAPVAAGKWTVSVAADDVVQALVAMKQAEATAIGTTMSNPVYSPEERVRQASTAMRAAFKAVRTAADELQAGADKTRTSLEASLLPQKPKDASEAAVYSRLDQLTRIVENFTGTPYDKIASIQKLLQNALQSGEELSSYVICHEMRYVFLRCGLNWTAVLQALVKTIAQSNPDAGPPSSGAALLALLQRGGPGTVGELLDVSRYMVVQAEQQWADFVRRANPNLYDFQK